MARAVLAGALLAVPLALLAAVPGEPDLPLLRRLGAEVRAAHGRQDWPAMRDAAARLHALAPGATRATYNLACAEARTGNSRAAVALLRRLADRGLLFDLAADEDFATLRGTAAFRSAAARLAANAAPRAKSTVAFRLGDPDLLTEGIAWDPGTRTHLVSSVHQRKVVRVDASGAVRDFTAPDARLDGVLGLAVDASRGALWAATAAVPEMRGGGADPARSALVEIDLRTGAVRRSLPAPGQGPHTLGDVAVSPDGRVFTSDARSGAVDVLGTGGDALSELVPPGRLASPQGLVVAPDGKALLVADYALGLVRVDLATGALAMVPAPDDAALDGIDGLQRWRSSLVAVVNGTAPARVVRLDMDQTFSRVLRARILESAHPLYEEPTLGAVAGDAFDYVAASQWERFGPKGREADRRPPLVLRLPLR